MNKGSPLGGAIAGTTKTQTHIGAMTESVLMTTERLGNLEVRMYNLIERAYGAQPQDPKERGDLKDRPSSATANLSDAVNNSDAAVTRLHNLFDRIENIV